MCSPKLWQTRILYRKDFSDRFCQYKYILSTYMCLVMLPCHNCSLKSFNYLFKPSVFTFGLSRGPSLLMCHNLSFSLVGVTTGHSSLINDKSLIHVVVTIGFRKLNFKRLNSLCGYPTEHTLQQEMLAHPCFSSAKTKFYFPRLSKFGMKTRIWIL